MRTALLSVCLAAVTAAAGTHNNDKLYDAIRSGNQHGLKTLLARGANPNAADARGITPLMYAASVGSPPAIKTLIARGADVNAQNAFGSTALMWSVTDPAKVKLLLDHGADVNLKSKTGRTALLVAAFSNPSAEVMRMLLAKGADPKVVDAAGVTTLNAATVGNDTDTIRLMVQAGVDVNAAERFGSTILPGSTPLMNATANGNVEAVKLLLSKGAKVNFMTTREGLQKVKFGPLALGGITPLMTAVEYGPAELVKTLLEAEADVNVFDIRGMTPLMLATAADHSNPEIIRLLLAHGADPEARDLGGETARDWARKNGVGEHLQTISLANPPAASQDIHAAVERSVRLLENTSAEFFRRSGCVSCHAQAATEFAIAAARLNGVAVNEQLAKDRQQQIVTLLNPAGPMLMERMDAPGSPDTILYILEALGRAGYAPSPLTDFLIANIAAQQTANGNWHIGGVARAPIEDGDFTRTAFAIRALKAYGTPGRAAETKARIERAKQWLLNAEPVTGEDHAMRLVALAAAGADAETLHRIARPVLAHQRRDGGWAQRSELESDAYMTGMTLWALAETGVMRPEEQPYAEGVAYLVATQQADGSWYVPSRAPKFQPYFESSFPHGHDQWISSAATGWATNALALALENAPATQIAAVDGR